MIDFKNGTISSDQIGINYCWFLQNFTMIDTLKLLKLGLIISFSYAVLNLVMQTVNHYYLYYIFIYVWIYFFHWQNNVFIFKTSVFTPFRMPQKLLRQLLWDLFWVATKSYSYSMRAITAFTSSLVRVWTSFRIESLNASAFFQNRIFKCECSKFTNAPNILHFSNLSLFMYFISGIFLSMKWLMKS